MSAPCTVEKCIRITPRGRAVHDGWIVVCHGRAVFWATHKRDAIAKANELNRSNDK